MKNLETCERNAAVAKLNGNFASNARYLALVVLAWFALAIWYDRDPPPNPDIGKPQIEPPTGREPNGGVDLRSLERSHGFLDCESSESVLLIMNSAKFRATCGQVHFASRRFIARVNLENVSGKRITDCHATGFWFPNKKVNLPSGSGVRIAKATCGNSIAPGDSAQLELVFGLSKPEERIGISFEIDRVAVE